MTPTRPANRLLPFAHGPQEFPLFPVLAGIPGLLSGLLAGVMLFASMVYGAGQAQEVEPRYQSLVMEFQSQKNGGSVAGWRRLGADFYDLYRAPESKSREADSLYSAALCFRQAHGNGGGWMDLNRAVELFQQFARDFPRHALADDSLVQIGTIFAQEYKDPHVAYLEFQKVVSTYPDGDQAPLARKKVSELAPQVKDRSSTREEAPVQGKLTGADESPLDGLPQAGLQPGSSGVGGVMRVSYHPQSPDQTGLNRTPALPGAGRAPHPQGELSQISQIQFLATKKRTRVLLTLTGDTPYQFAELPAGKDLRRRIYVDLFQARPGPALASSYQVKSPHVSQVRLGRYDTFTTRLVLDVEQAGGFTVDHLLAAHGKKIIIDLYSKAEDVPAAASPGQQASSSGKAVSSGGTDVLRQKKQSQIQKDLPPQKEAAAPPAQHPGSMNLRQALGLKVRSIVIDPGHGGKDPGAVGFGLREKDVALNIAKALRVEFKRQLPDIRVVLTRENDRFIPLDERPVLAKKLGGDLFVSIHLNAHEEERIQGVETYFLNLTADSSAIRVAARENFSTKKQVGELNTILRKLLRNTKIEESENLARKVQAAVVGGFGPRRKVRNLGVKQAPFMVLLGSEMPSVLVEAGFISNKKENKRLRDPKYIRGVAQGIFKGLRDYIQEPAFSAFNPTPDSTTAVAATPGP